MMMRWNAGGWRAAWLGLWLVACGGLSEKDFPAAYIEATCDWRARCGVIRDEGACVRDARARHQAALAAADVSFPYQQPYSGSLRAGRMRFDEDRARQCVERLQKLSCASAMDPDLLFLDCSPYVGQRGAGEACVLDPECVEGFHCGDEAVPANVCTPRTCVPDAAAGERLTAFGHKCAPGLASTVDGVCQPESGEGSACSSRAPCAVGLYCDPQSAVCRARGKEGEACVPGTAPCLFHLDCGDDGTCHRPANLGESCTGSVYVRLRDREDRSTPPAPSATWPVILRCKEDLYCTGDLNKRGVCAEPQGEGAACRSPDACRFPGVCASVSRELSTCQSPGKVGAPCGNARCVPGAWCDSRTGTCAAQAKTLGAACDAFDFYSSCVSGFQCEDGRCMPSSGGTCEG